VHSCAAFLLLDDAYPFLINYVMSLKELLEDALFAGADEEDLDKGTYE
jgi:hypothetical protein